MCANICRMLIHTSTVLCHSLFAASQHELQTENSLTMCLESPAIVLQLFRKKRERGGLIIETTFTSLFLWNIYNGETYNFKIKWCHKNSPFLVWCLRSADSVFSGVPPWWLIEEWMQKGGHSIQWAPYLLLAGQRGACCAEGLFVRMDKFKLGLIYSSMEAQQPD